MITYQCDSCKRTIENPYKVKLKEFNIDVNYDFGIGFPINRKHKINIHICDDCYKALHLIAKNKEREHGK